MKHATVKMTSAKPEIMRAAYSATPMMAFFFFCMFFFCLPDSYAQQPAWLGTDVVSGSYSTYALSAAGSLKQVRLQATASASPGVRKWEFTKDNSGAPDYSENWRPYSGACNSNPDLTLNGFNALVTPASGFPAPYASATYNSAFGGCSAYLPAITANNYYTFNIQNVTAASANMEVLETSYNPVTISGISPSPNAASVSMLVPVTITITTAAAPSSGENIFVRYSTNGFTTSTIVQALFTGANGTALIPATTGTVQYYVYSSNKSLSDINADVAAHGEVAHDMATLNVNNNGNSNYSYTTSAANPVLVTSTGSPSNNATYLTLGAAFAAIDSGIHTSAIAVRIYGNTSEGTATATLIASDTGNASYSSISIQPAAGTAITVSGATAAGNPLIYFLGADHVMIDGLNSGGNSLTIENTTVSNLDQTSTIKFFDGASHNAITRCSIKGSSTAAWNTYESGGTVNGGNILFYTDFNHSNNISHHDTISYCNIGPSGSNLPANAIYAGTLMNSGDDILIDHNNIFDYFSPTISSTGIAVYATCKRWTVSNNRFYQTAARVFTSGVVHTAISFQFGGGESANITGNVIGFASNSQTGTYALSGSSGKFRGIYFWWDDSNLSTISNNTIASVSLTGVTSNGNDENSPFTGILIYNALVNLVDNTIGSPSSTGSITFSTNSSGSLHVHGIYIQFASTPVTLSGNTIGGMSFTNTGLGTTVVYGLRTGTVPALTVSSNTIGGGVTNSILLTAVGTNSHVYGTFFISDSGIFTSNTIQNLTTNVGSGTNLGASMIGMEAHGAMSTISHNKICNLQGNIGMSGILFTSSAGIVESNLIYGFSSGTVAPSAEINGIRINSGTSIYKNNMIAFGAGISKAPGAAASNTSVIGVNGILETGGVNNIWNNSIYIGGSPTTSPGNSYAFNSTITGSTRSIRNNIFFNARSNSGSAGKNYVIKLNGTAPNPVGLKIDNNDYYATGNGNVFGYYNGADVINLAAWKVAVGQDTSSFQANPQYLDPSNSTPDLHINAVVASVTEGNGFDTGVTDDFDGELRSALSPVDLGADAGDFIKVDLLAPTISYIPLLQDTVVPYRSLSNVTIQDAESGLNANPGARPRCYYKKSTDANTVNDNTGTTNGWKYAEANGNTSPFDFTIDYSKLFGGNGVVSGDVIQYFVVAQDLAAAPNVGINSGLFSSIPSSVALTSAVFPITGPINSYKVNTPLKGIITVCTSGCNYNSLTNVGGAFAAINSSTVTGNITLLINGDLLSETGANTLDEFLSPWTVTIKPSGSARTISGTCAGGLITINGADRVTIDGSLGNVPNTVCPVSSATRDLTITNNNTGTSSSVVWIQTTTGNNSATNNTVKNCNIAGSGAANTLCGIGSGVSGTLYGNNNHNSFINNSISKARNGIYVSGASATGKNTGTIINQNQMNTASPNNVGISGISVFYEDSVTISGNQISVAAPNGQSFNSCGIALGAQTISGSSLEVTNASIIKNIVETVHSSPGFNACGILVSYAGSGITTVADNMVSGVQGSGFLLNYSVGIMVLNDPGSVTQLFNNSVSMSAIPVSGSNHSYCIGIAGNNPSVSIRNNLLLNTQYNGTGNNYAIGYGYNTFTNLTSSNNSYFVPSGSKYFIGATGSLTSPTSQLTIGDLQAATGQDGSAQNVNAVFTTPALHLIAGASVNAALNNAGDGTNTISDDIDCEAWQNDIGADEFTPCTAPAASASAPPQVCTGQTLQLTGTTDTGNSFLWTGPNGFTSTAQNPAIPNTTFANAGIYFFSASANGCASAPSAVTVVVKTSPSTVSVTPVADSICSTGNPAALTANGGSINVNATSGTQQVQTSSLAPYVLFYGGIRMQFLVLASELTAMGYSAGYQFTSVGFPVATASASSVNNFQVKIGQTTLTTLSSFQTGLTQVVAPHNFVTVAGSGNTGSNLQTFNAPFAWDGTSNLIIETTFSNNNSGIANGPVQYFTGTAFTSMVFFFANNQSASFVASSTSVMINNGNRPDFTLNGVNPAIYTWFPAVGLSSSTGATVNAFPAANTTYTASVTSNGCSTSATSEITVFSPALWYVDADHDGFGDVNDPGVIYCIPPAGVIMDHSDCGDNNANVHPGVAEICNSLDDDCDGNIDNIAPPVASFTVSCNLLYPGNTATLTSTSTAGSGTISAYQWNLNGNSITGATNAVYTTGANESGDYTLTVTNSNHCNSTSGVSTINNLSGPLAAGTYSIPVTCGFSSINVAATYINANGLSGSVVFEVAAGYTETAPTDGIVFGQCALSSSLKSSASQTVTFRKSGTGANPLVKEPVGTGILDGIIKIIGMDYLTFDAIDLTDTIPNINIFPNNFYMEWGYALLKCTGNDGSNYVTIRNCNIRMNRYNPNGSKGIYSNNHNSSSNTQLTYTGPANDPAAIDASRNGHNSFYGNIITHVHSGISLTGNGSSSGSYSLKDTLNQIGIPASGNKITSGNNFASSQTTSLEILNQQNATVVNNYIYTGYSLVGDPVYSGSLTAMSLGSSDGTVSNDTVYYFGGLNSGTFEGIVANGFTTVTGNAVRLDGINPDDNSTLTGYSCIMGSSTGSTLAFNSNKLTRSYFNGGQSLNGMVVSFPDGSTGTCSNNRVDTVNFGVAKPAGTNGTMISISGGANSSVSVTHNTVTNFFILPHGTVTMLAVQGYNVNVDSNTITKNYMRNLSVGNSILTGISINAQASYNCRGNLVVHDSIGTNSSNSSLTASLVGIKISGSCVSENISNNTLSDLQALVGGYNGNVTGISISTNSSSTRLVEGNVITRLSSGHQGGIIIGLQSGNGGTVTVSKNRIDSLYAVFPKSITGILNTGGTVTTYSNNFIGQLSTSTFYPTGTTVNGFQFDGGAAVNFYNNTIYITPNNSGDQLSTSGIYAAVSSPLDLRNNIIVNLAANGSSSGNAVAYRRASPGFTGYTVTSDNNLFYSGTPSSTHLIYYDGTNASQTLAAYKYLAATRDQHSKSENVNFTSTQSVNPGFLHVNPSIPSYAESGGTNIAGITNDYDGDIRQGNGGYSGTGTASDIGADEFEGIPGDLTAPAISYAAIGDTLCPTDFTLSVVITDINEVNTSAGMKPRLYFKKATDANTYAGNTAVNNGWKYVEASNGSSPFSFTTNFTLLQSAAVTDDIIQYFVVAEDLASTPNAGVNSAAFANAPFGVALTSTAFPVVGTINSTAIVSPVTLYADADGDGYDVGSITVCYKTIPPGYSSTTNGTDCDDNNILAHAVQTWYLDADGDTYYISSISSCGSPAAGYNTTGGTLGDCDDNNNTVWQSASLYIDADADGYDAGTSTVCYGATIPSGYSAISSGSDCDDNNSLAHSLQTWYLDADNDTHYVSSVSSCGSPGAGYNTSGGTLNDCDDNNNSVWQSSSLYIDADADGYDAGTSTVCYGATIPVGYSSTTNGSDCNDSDDMKWQSPSLYIDADADGYDAGSTTVCYGATIPLGYSAISSGSDCDDNNSLAHSFQTWYLDADNDTHYVSSVSSCGTPGAVYNTSGGTLSDCDDNNNSVWQSSSLYVDADADGYDAGTSTVCYGATVPSGYSATTNGADCNDNDNTSWQSPSLYIDADADGYDAGSTTVCYGATIPSGYSAISSGSDCDDNNSLAHSLQTWYLDADNDTHYVSSVSSCGSPGAGYNTSGGTLNDCDDNNNSVWQSASLYIDEDADGYDAGSTTVCYGATIPSGYSATTNGVDCDDNNMNVYPGAIETCNSIDDNCNTQVDENGVATSIATSDATTFCNPGSALLNGSPTGVGYSYQWYEGASLIGGATNSSYTADASGNYSVVIVLASCTGTSNTISVTENPLPVAIITPANPAPVCKGIPILLSANTGDGLTYQWYSFVNPIAGATNATYLVPGYNQKKYTVAVTNSFGCTATSNEVDILRLATPKAIIEILNPVDNPDLCINGQVRLRANGGESLGYQWKLNGNDIPAATSRSYNATIAGNYRVTVTKLSTGCSDLSPAVTVVAPCKEADIDHLKHEAINLYPNPTDGHFVLHLTLTNEVDGDAIVQVFNALGQAVIMETVHVVNGEITKELSLTHNEAAGMYLVRLIFNGQVFKQQLVYLR